MKILIINPNTDQSFTELIGKSAALVAAEGTAVRCLSAPNAPLFIENYRDDVLCAPGMMALVKEWEHETDAFVIACTCDPNLDILRELTDKPVLGAGECSMLLSLTLGGCFSVLQTTAHSVPMKRHLVRKYGFEGRCASVVAIDESLGSTGGTMPNKIMANKMMEDKMMVDKMMEDRLYEAGKIAVERDGAEVLALGCAGLAGLDARLRERLGVPVVDGVAASVKIAEAVVSSGNKTSKKGSYAAKEPF